MPTHDWSWIVPVSVALGGLLTATGVVLDRFLAGVFRRREAAERAGSREAWETVSRLDERIKEAERRLEECSRRERAAHSVTLYFYGLLSRMAAAMRAAGQQVEAIPSLTELGLVDFTRPPASPVPPSERPHDS
jgi:hypothetical protein